MNMIIPTKEELEVIESGIPRTDWSPLYAALAENGVVLFDEMPPNLRSVLNSHYRKTKKIARVKTLTDGRILVRLETRNGTTSQV